MLSVQTEMCLLTTPEVGYMSVRLPLAAQWTVSLPKVPLFLSTLREI